MSRLIRLVGLGGCRCTYRIPPPYGPVKDCMLVYHRVTSDGVKFTSTHLYTWVERGTIRVKYLAQEHNKVLQSVLKPILLNS